MYALVRSDKIPGVLSGLSVEGYAARIAARNDTRFIASCAQPDTYAMTQAIVREAYIAEGKLSNYNPEDVIYLSNDQFAYTTGVLGIIAREKPGAAFLIGRPAAELMPILEASKREGAFTIGGHDLFGSIATMIPVTDYVLIGPELFAAGAYCSRDPESKSTIAGQDLTNMLMLVILILGTLASLIGSDIITWLITQ
jgi:hypothetical protein